MKQFQVVANVHLNNDMLDYDSLNTSEEYDCITCTDNKNINLLKSKNEISSSYSYDANYFSGSTFNEQCFYDQINSLYNEALNNAKSSTFINFGHYKYNHFDIVNYTIKNIIFQSSNIGTHKAMSIFQVNTDTSSIINLYNPNNNISPIILSNQLEAINMYNIAVNNCKKNLPALFVIFQINEAYITLVLLDYVQFDHLHFIWVDHVLKYLNNQTASNVVAYQNNLPNFIPSKCLNKSSLIKICANFYSSSKYYDENLDTFLFSVILLL